VTSCVFVDVCEAARRHISEKNNNKHLLHLDFPKSHELNFFLPGVVTDDPGSKPAQKYARRRQAELRGKNKVRFRTSSKRISLVYSILVHCEGVDCKVTGIKFMAVFIMRRDAACF